MSRRPVNPGRRFPDSASIPFAGAFHHKTQSSPILSVGLVILGALLFIGYSYGGSGGFGSNREATEDEASSCTSEALKTIPFLQKVYGDSMHKVLHVGPDTCSVVSKLLKEEDTEAWGVEPYDLEDADSTCKSLVRKGIVRVADIKFALPYRPKSFSLVIVSDALDYLSPRYLNKTLPDLARVSTDGVVVFSELPSNTTQGQNLVHMNVMLSTPGPGHGLNTSWHEIKAELVSSAILIVGQCLSGVQKIICRSLGYPGQERTKVQDLSKFGKPAKLRSSSWWIRYFVQMGLEENETATKKFEQAASKRSYKPDCQVFHLNG